MSSQAGADHPTVRRVVILHGYNANPGKHWFDWLAADLAADGIAVSTPALPDSATPTLEHWIRAAQAAVGEPDDSLVIVGHSLGSITAVKTLAALDGEWMLGGLVLVAGFAEPLVNLPAIDGFTVSPVSPESFGTIIRNTRSRRMLVSDDGDVVDPLLSHRLAADLEAEVTVVAAGGHFRADDGYTSFAELASHIRLMFA